MDYKEIFDRYLDGRLSAEELKEFEKSVREDPLLAGELDQYRRLNSVSEKIFTSVTADQQAKDDIQSYKQHDLSKDIDLQNFKRSLDKAHKSGPSPLWYAAAVTLAGAITVAFILLLKGQTEMPEMFARYYEPYHQSERIIEITRSDDDLYFAIQLFESGDYSRAAVFFNQLSDSLNNSSYSSFYAGLIYIQQEKWEMAIDAFIQVINDGNVYILGDARWYLGLCYLRVENAPAAREQFEILSEGKNEYSKRARKILRHLD